MTDAHANEYAHQRQSVHVDERVCASCSAEASRYRCKSCKRVAYCSPDCQMADWTHEGHASECGEARAEPAAVGKLFGKRRPKEAAPGTPVATRYGDFQRIYKRAKANRRPLVAFFGVGYCRYCRVFRPKFNKLASRPSWRNADVRTVYVDMMAIQSQGMEADDGNESDEELEERRQAKDLAQSVRRYPTVILYDTDGAVMKVWNGTPDTSTLDEMVIDAAERRE